MNAVKKDWLVALAVAIISVAVFVLDTILLQDFLLPAAPYAIPILVATYFLGFRWVVGTTAGVIVLQAIGGLLGVTPVTSWILVTMSLLIIGGVSTLLVRRRSQLNQLAEERAQLIDDLEVERARLRAIIENAPEGIVVSDEQARVLLANPVADQISQRPAPYGQEYGSFAIMGYRYPDGTPVDPRDLPLTRSALDGETVRGEEVVIFWSDGQRRNVLVNSAPITDSRGKITGAVTVFQDITERKQAEAERERLLREVQRRAAELDATISSIPVGVVIYDRGGEIRRLNQGGQDILGYTPEERQRPIEERLRSLRILNAAGQEVAPRDTPPARALRGETVHNETYIIHPPHVGMVWLSTSAAPIIADGEQIGAVVALVDITRLQELTQLADRRSAELRSIIDNIVDGVYVANTEGIITLTNEAGARLLGLDGTQEAYRPWEELVALVRARHLDGSSMKVEEESIPRALRGEVVVQDEMISDVKTNRDVFLRISAAPIRDDRGKITGAVAVARDITELLELDQLKDEFIRVAAHELRTPVTVVKGYAQALARTGSDLPEKSRAFLTAIDRGANRIDRIVDDLMDISQLQLGQISLKKEKVNLLKMVEDVIKSRAAGVPKHQIKLLRGEPAVVRGDYQRLEQVIQQLIDNAIRYSPRGGAVEVSVETQAGQVVVAVRDYGIGIPQEKQKRLFQRFYRAHAGTRYDFGGMGVGLFIAREIVRSHCGRMWFESKEGQGSTFYFTLPLANGE